MHPLEANSLANDPTENLFPINPWENMTGINLAFSLEKSE